MLPAQFPRFGKNSCQDLSLSLCRSAKIPRSSSRLNLRARIFDIKFRKYIELSTTCIRDRTCDAASKHFAGGRSCSAGGSHSSTNPYMIISNRPLVLNAKTTAKGISNF